MANFPPVRTLIVPASQWYSREASATLSGELTAYPASSAVDGSRAEAARSSFGSATLTIDVGSSVDVNILGVLHHNVDVTRIFGFSSGSFLRGAAARHPNFWVDARTLAGNNLTGQVFNFFVTGNTKPLSLAEAVVAKGHIFHGSLEEYPDENYKAYQSRLTLEQGAQAISASGTYQRTGQLRLSMQNSELPLLDQIFNEAGLTGERVIVVPDTRKNDIWLCEWPDNYEKTYPKSFLDQIEVTIPLIEETGGVL